jgi:hypothetical protein
MIFVLVEMAVVAQVVLEAVLGGVMVVAKTVVTAHIFN